MNQMQFRLFFSDNYFHKFTYLILSPFRYLIKCNSSLRFFFKKFTCVVLSFNACVILIKTHLPNVPECNLFTWFEVYMMQEAHFYGAISVASWQLVLTKCHMNYPCLYAAGFMVWLLRWQVTWVLWYLKSPATAFARQQRWKHQSSTLLALYGVNPSMIGGFPSCNLENVSMS